MGDEDNKDIDVEHYACLDLPSADIGHLAGRYDHMSTGHHTFEWICILRWFLLKNFLVKNDIEKCFYADTDIMIYSNITEEMKKYEDKKMAIIYPSEQTEYRWAASGHSSYWTKESLIDFCDFVLNMYSSEEGRSKLREKWNYHRNNKIPGGICDMSLIYLYYNQNEGKDIGILSEVTEGSAYDDNINSSENRYKDEYAMMGRFKNIKWQNGVPYCYNLMQEDWIRFNTLHFQGTSGKNYMDQIKNDS